MTKFKAHPLAEALAKNGKMATVTGFVGRAEDGRVRLYPTVGSDSTLEFDEQDVCHVTEGDSHDQPSRFYLTESATVTITANVSAASIPGSTESATGSKKSCADESFDWWWRCINAGFSVDFCTEGSRWIEDGCNLMSGAPVTGPAKLS